MPREDFIEDNLATTWRNIVTNGGIEPLMPHIRAMNQALGTNYLNHNITIWQRGERAPDIATINYMMDTVLGHVLRRHGLDTVAINEVKRKTKLHRGE